MNPKEAQEQTERKWAFLITTQPEEPDGIPDCGWCDFAMETGGGCDSCPVVVVFGQQCDDLLTYSNWVVSGHSPWAAKEVYDLVVANRDALIQAGEEILREQTIRI